MNLPKLKIILLLFLFILSAGLAQEKEIKQSNQQWIQYYNQLNFSEDWMLLSDAGFRWKDFLGESSQYIIRAGAGYKLNSDMRAAVGIATSGNYNGNKVSKTEIRPYQEFIISQGYDLISLQHRFRIEERFFSDNGNNSFNFRFRYGFSVSIPLIEFSSCNPDFKLLINAGDEIFINAGADIVYNVFDQNRVLIGPAIQLNKDLVFALIYNYQFGASNSPGEYKHDNIFWFTVKHKVDAY